LAKIQLNKIKPIIIGIGGSSGKSSLAQISSQILSQKYRVKQGKGKNSETGIPLNILDIDIEDYGLKTWLKIAIIAPIKLITNNKKYDIYVVEMGIDSPYPPKNMSYLLSFIKPKISVLTNINIEHSVYFEDFSKKDNPNERRDEILQKIASEEKLLITGIDQSGRVIVNLDDLYIKSTLPLNAKTVTVSSRDSSADFYIKNIKIAVDAFMVKFTFLKEEYEISINQPLPRYYAHIFIYAIALAFSNEINIKDSINFIQNNFSLPPGRFGMFKGLKNSTIFDSSYNSSLEASIGALETLKEIGKDVRKVGILGDMRELGSLSQIQHEALAKEILKSLDFAILIGPQIKEYTAPILEKNNFDFKSFETFKEAREYIVDSVRRNDLILVKGSQNTLYLERAVELLLANKEEKALLCRRGKYWDKIRQRAN
jgi:UDP-N-acetylmuramoyl-tripeptide--D-alanyl-D-alanine ligase